MVGLLVVVSEIPNSKRGIGDTIEFEIKATIHAGQSYTD